MKKLFEKITGIWVIIALSILGIFLIFILPIYSGYLSKVLNTPLIPDTMIFYSPTILYNLASVYKEAGIEAYILSKYTLDIIWPLAYLFSLMIIMLHLYQILKQYRGALLLPILAFIFDILENISLIIVFSNYPNETGALGYLASAFTILKWFTLVFCLIFILIYLGRIRNIRLQKKEDEHHE
ncbi:MAG: hypothetical protein AB7V00_05490 [Bacilli bacterium]